MFFSCDGRSSQAVEWTIAYLLADCVIMAAEGDELPGWGPLLHHAIVGFGFWRGVSTGFTTQYHSLFLLNEASTVPLHLITLLRGSGKRVLLLNGMALWASFLVSRLVCNAWIFANVGWHLSRGDDDGSGGCEDDREARRRLLRDPAVFRELVMQLGLAGAAQVLNVVWFARITKTLLSRLAQPKA